MKKLTEPYIFAFDMDGTLLNKNKKISFKTFCLLRKLTRQGHHVILASGRPSRSMKTYYKKLKLNTPMVCYNGEFIFSPKDPNFKEVKHIIPKDVTLEVIDKLGSNLLNVMCETDDEIWIDKEDKYLDIFFWFKGMNVHTGELKDTLDKGTMTCLIHIPEEYKNSSKEEIDNIVAKYDDIMPVYWIGKPYFELHHKGTTKGDALKVIQDYYKIPTSRIISFGDATNDIEMFEASGTSIMMSNAKYDIKDKATMVSIKDNNHNGIYYTLKQIFK